MILNGVCLVLVVFDLVLYIPINNFLSYRDDSEVPEKNMGFVLHVLVSSLIFVRSLFL